MRISDWSSDVCSSDLHDDQADAKYFGEPNQIEQRCRDWIGPDRRWREIGRRNPAKHRNREHRKNDGAKKGKNLDRSVLRPGERRSEEHTSELQSLMRISYAVFCLKTKKNQTTKRKQHQQKAYI